MPSPETQSTSPRDIWLNRHVLLRFGRVDEPRDGARWRETWTSRAADGAAIEIELLGFVSPIGAPLETALVDLMREHVGGSNLDAALQAKLMTTLSWDMPAAELRVLAERLHGLRDATRRRLPTPLFGGRPMLCVDVLARTGLRRVYFKGWWRRCHGLPVRLTAVSPEGERRELLPSVVTFERRDIDPLHDGDRYTGFTACVQLNRPSPLRGGWLLELATADGFAVESAAGAVLEESEDALRAVLPDVELQRPPLRDGPAELVHAFVADVVAKRVAEAQVDHDVVFGTPVARPMVTVIVPLYRRIDLMEHQVAEFALDGAWAECELIYILDSPELWERCAWRAAQLAALHGVTLRLMRVPHNVGYATVNNLAARLARSSRLLFLNSDVLPCAPGWVERMLTAYSARPGVGALGPKLIFEDNSIQHAGVGYAPMNDGFGWDTLAFHKGLHRAFPEAGIARTVPAITGACLMIDKAAFLRVEGFDQGYIQGDFEDMDLCLRLLRAGYQNWYDPTVECYHLEGVSYPLAERQRNARYNRWLHSRKWGGLIEKLSGQDSNPFRTEDQIPA